MHYSLLESAKNNEKGSALVAVSFLAYKYQTRVDVTVSYKHSSLLQPRINYGPKKLYS
jgi:hypothetical protein